MIIKIKNKLKNFVDSKVSLLKTHQHLLQQTNFNYNQISHLFKEDSFIPFSAWAISPSTILHVLNDITLNKRQNVIEFGAGASTFYIAKLIKVLDLNTVFYSIESDKYWAEEIQNQIQILKIEDFVKVIYAPLTPISGNIALRNQKKWYDPNLLEEKLPKKISFDLLLVDGPFGGSSPFARYSAVPFLKSKLAANFSIFLDDVNRPDEQEIIREWSEFLDCEIQFKERYGVISNSRNFNVTPFRIG